LKIDSVKIFGERHTGTNALSLFLRENFNLKFKYYEFLGWKHRLAPKKAEWIKHNTDNVLFIFLFRNPYTWLNSMYKEPYYHHYLKINDRSFEEFIKFSIEDYENSITMWNQKNDSYFRMSDEMPNSIIINVEDFYADQKKFHINIANKLSRYDMPFIKMNDYVNGRGWHKKRDIASSLRIPKLDKQLIRIINSFLSEKIMKKCKYELLI